MTLELLSEVTKDGPLTPEIKLWLDLISNFGVPVGLLAALVLAGFQVLPGLKKRLKSASKQSEVLTRCLPSMEQSVRKMADSNEAQLVMLNKIDHKLEGMVELNRKIDLLVSKMPK